MAKYCQSCRQFKGNIKTCQICKNAVCGDCRISNVCKDCFLTINEKNVLGDYYNDKKIFNLV